MTQTLRDRLETGLARRVSTREYEDFIEQVYKDVLTVEEIIKQWAQRERVEREVFGE